MTHWAIEAHALGCRLGARPVFSRLDLAVPRGALVGVLGPNGAGKTTLLRCLLGLARRTEGRLEVLGKDPGAVRASIGYVSQGEPPEMSQHLSAVASVAAAFQGERWGFPLHWRLERRHALEALDAAEAGALAQRPLGELSGGQRQRVRIAQALVNAPQLLLLDEPLASLDQGGQQAVLRLAKRLCLDKGITVLMSAHDLNPLLEYIDLVLYMANGQGRLGTVDEVVQEDVLSALYGLPMRATRVDGRIFVHPDSGFIPELTDCCPHCAGGK
ncbi:MAG: ATP-binding cassette domain-containing protein [Betaproteobacteria bacterium]|nr:ATP-binding cassette domain-containing protein [Betaproteobacteria bacterium]